MQGGEARLPKLLVLGSRDVPVLWRGLPNKITATLKELSLLGGLGQSETMNDLLKQETLDIAFQCCLENGYLRLRALNPDQNVFREYELHISRCLFGTHVVQIAFGRIGTRGPRSKSRIWHSRSCCNVHQKVPQKKAQFRQAYRLRVHSPPLPFNEKALIFPTLSHHKPEVYFLTLSYFLRRPLWLLFW